MCTPGVPLARSVAVTCLVLVAALLTAPPSVAGPAPAPAARPTLRLEPVGGSGLSSLDLPLASRLRSTPAGDRRTPRFATTGHSIVAVTWQGRAAELRVRSRAEGRWSGWRHAEPLDDLPDPDHEGLAGTRGTEPLWFGRSDGVQVSVRGRTPAGLALVLIDPGALAGVDEATAPELSARTSAATDSAPRPVLRSRRDWGADETWRTSAPRYSRALKQVHLHHTATGNAYRRRDVPGLIRGMYRYHTHNLGWSDLGYNFLVDRFGRTWVGRAGGAARRVRGAHTLGFNHASTGVAVVGNFQDQAPIREVRRAIVRLSAWKLDREGREPNGAVWRTSEGSDRYPEGVRVRLPVMDGHRDTNQTACPGQELYDQLPRIRWATQMRADRF